MRNFEFWQRWLIGIGILITAFGVVMALFNSTFFFALFNNQIDPVFWGSRGPEGGAIAFQRWVYGGWGATVAGWGLTIAFLAAYAFRTKESWVRNGLTMGLGLWFVLDTVISLRERVFFNAAFNCVLMLIVAVPLVFTWNEFKHGQGGIRGYSEQG